MGLSTSKDDNDKEDSTFQRLCTHTELMSYYNVEFLKLKERVRQCLFTLGYNESKWQNHDSPPLCNVAWNALEDYEQVAASELGYTEQLWIEEGKRALDNRLKAEATKRKAEEDAKKKKKDDDRLKAEAIKRKEEEDAKKKKKEDEAAALQLQQQQTETAALLADEQQKAAAVLQLEAEAATKRAAEAKKAAETAILSAKKQHEEVVALQRQQQQQAAAAARTSSLLVTNDIVEERELEDAEPKKATAHEEFILLCKTKWNRLDLDFKYHLEGLGFDEKSWKEKKLPPAFFSQVA